MKYTIITQKCGCHLLVEALLKSIHKYLKPDEILVTDGKCWQHRGMRDISSQLHEEILKARNEYVLMLDQDILIFDNSLIEEMLSNMVKPDVFVCGAFTHDYKVKGYPDFLVASCNMLNKQRYLEGITFDKTSHTEPCTEPFTHAINKGQKMIVLNPGKRVFHLNAGFKQTYGDLIVNGYWKFYFDRWKLDTGSNEVLEDYINDDGMDIIDLAHLNNYTSSLIEHWSKDGGGHSFLLINEADFKYIDNYNLLGERDKKLTEELLNHIKEATFLPHPRLYKNFFDDSFSNKTMISKYSELYDRLDIYDRAFGYEYFGRYVLPIQNYMCLVDNFDISFYDIVRGKSIVYLGPYDAVGELNKKKNLGMIEYKYYPLTSSNAYNDMENFFKESNPKDYQLVITNGDFYGNIIAGRVRNFNKMSFNIGDALSFNLNDTLKTFLEVTKDGTAYKLRDNYKNYGSRMYEKYLI